MYSSLILAGFGVKELGKPVETSLDPVLHNYGGLIRERKPGASFREISNIPSTTISTPHIYMAILKKKIK